MLQIPPSGGPRRRLFDQPENRGSLVQDAVLLGLEVRIPHEGFTAAALLDWALLAEGTPDLQTQAKWAGIACECRHAQIVLGRGARTSLGPFDPGGPNGGCCAVVQLQDGSVCQVYREADARPDGAVAVLAPQGGAVLEIRYRTDESVEVLLDSGGRVVKLPRAGLIFHETEDAERYISRCGAGEGAAHESADGTAAEAWLNPEAGGADGDTAVVMTSMGRKAKGLSLETLDCDAAGTLAVQAKTTGVAWETLDCDGSGVVAITVEPSDLVHQGPSAEMQAAFPLLQPHPTAAALEAPTPRPPSPWSQRRAAAAAQKSH